MLSYLHVQNIALIDELEVDFETGYNVMTGETGAGKSIIIGAMNAVLGSRMDKGFIREGADAAMIELLFNTGPEEAAALCAAYGLEENEEGELLVSRRAAANGRSVYKVNGQTVNAKTVKELAGRLIDIHSQHEHQSLLRKENHIALLDRYLGDKVSKVKAVLAELDKTRAALRRQKGLFNQDEAARIREIDFLAFEINEIESARLKAGEDGLLEKQYRLLNGARKIQTALDKVHRMASPSVEGSISSLAGACLGAIQGISMLDDGLASLEEQMATIDSLAQDFARDLEHYAASMESDDEALSRVEERIDAIHQLKNKYGETIEAIMENLDKKKQTHDELVHYGENIARIRKELEETGAAMEKAAQELTAIRTEGARGIAEEIQHILSELNFQNCQVSFHFERRHAVDAMGQDDVEILIATNKNEPQKPLVQIASGGELSRVMLAIKTVFADLDDIGTLVFDEIDTGISGRTAQKVAERITALSRKRQVLCITHLPQLAAMADTHYLIEKTDAGDKAATTMRRMDREETIHELARLVGGAKITDNVLASAREMKTLAQAVKDGGGHLKNA